jgi:hypothetical protein
VTGKKQEFGSKKQKPQAEWATELRTETAGAKLEEQFSGCGSENGERMPDGDKIHDGGEPVKTQTAGAKLEKQFVLMKEIFTEAPTWCAGVRDSRHRKGRYYLWDAKTEASRRDDRRNWQEAEMRGR